MSTNRRAAGARSVRSGAALSFVHASILLACLCLTPSLAGCTSRVAVRFERPQQALILRRPALYPETIEYDRVHDQFLVGSFREGAVYRVDAEGGVTPLVEDPRLCSVLGIAVDGARGRLWVVNSDLGASVRPSSAGPRKLAAVGVYDLSTGAPLDYIDLAPLSAGEHLLNGIAVDGDGNAYVTDSFSPVIYKIDRDGRPTVFLRDERFVGPGINLNGLVVHPDGYLLVVKKSDGALFKVPLGNPAGATSVTTSERVVGGDGVTLVGKKGLVIIANQTPERAANAAYYLSSSDDWTSATVGPAQPLGDVYPTTAALRRDQLYVLHSKLNELIQSPPDRKAGLAEQARIQRIGSVAPEAPVREAVSRTLLEQHDLPEMPGWESRLYLIEYGPGVVAPVHHHPVAGWGYVVSGGFESAFAGENPVVVRAGQSFVERADAPHLLFRNVDPSAPLKFVIAFVARKGEPVLVIP